MSSPQPDEAPIAEPLGEIVPSSPPVDSAVEDDDDFSTQSLTSDILKYQVENGRTYHAYRRGRYPLPNDKTEQERLDLMHEVHLLTFDGELVLNPGRGTAKRVLDIGTGTGVWATDYADRNPHSHVIGVDLSPIQSPWVPPNCEFEIDDIEEEWERKYKFDLIFGRSMIASIQDWPALAQKAYQNLEPGGYFEIQDHEYPLYGNHDDGEFEKTNLYKWSVTMVEAAKKSGRPIDVAPRFEEILREAGFVDVRQQRRPVPIGAWPRDPNLKLIGRVVSGMLRTNLEGISSALLTRHLEWKEEEMHVFLAQVCKDLRNPGLFPLSNSYVVWGRKPLDAT